MALPRPVARWLAAPGGGRVPSARARGERAGRPAAGPSPLGRGGRAGAGLFAALGLAAACGSGVQFHGGEYRDAEIAFRVGPVPESWRRVDQEEARLAFRDDAARATVVVGGRCGKDADDVPLESLTHHLFLQFTDRVPLAQRRFPLDGREALRSELWARLDGVKKHFVVYVIKKDGCVYDFVRVADTADPARVGEFDRFVRGFAGHGATEDP